MALLCLLWCRLCVRRFAIFSYSASVSGSIEKPNKSLNICVCADQICCKKGWWFTRLWAKFNALCEMHIIWFYEVRTSFDVEFCLLPFFVHALVVDFPFKYQDLNYTEQSSYEFILWPLSKPVEYSSCYYQRNAFKN